MRFLGSQIVLCDRVADSRSPGPAARGAKEFSKGARRRGPAPPARGQRRRGYDVFDVAPRGGGSRVARRPLVQAALRGRAEY